VVDPQRLAWIRPAQLLCGQPALRFIDHQQELLGGGLEDDKVTW
jgi:hypothetical protein